MRGRAKGDQRSATRLLHRVAAGRWFLPTKRLPCDAIEASHEKFASVVLYC